MSSREEWESEHEGFHWPPRSKDSDLLGRAIALSRGAAAADFAGAARCAGGRSEISADLSGTGRQRPSDANDPRSALKPGLFDAGEAANGIKHVAFLKKPGAFQLMATTPDDATVQKTLQLLETRTPPEFRTFPF